MILTICLVTKGREAYLDAILNSLQPVLSDPRIKILVIDNGAPSVVSTKIKDWGGKYLSSVKIVRFDINDSRPQQTWNVLEQQNSNWVVFPSDDDIFCPEIIQAWREALELNPSLVAFAPAVRLINIVGETTGEELNPSGSQYNSKIAQVAASFHEPPFVWPSLFMQISSLPKELPSSRFAFDWWVGVHLLLVGQVTFSKDIGVLYRVHEEQESFLAPHRRKYFEAQMWLSDIIESSQFEDWIRRLSDEERLTFWHIVKNKKPIYGDPFFSRAILHILFRKIYQAMESPQTKAETILNFALESGVLLKDGEVKNLLPKSPIGEAMLRGNLHIQLDSMACDDLLAAGELFAGADSSRTFKVYCRHSNEKSKSVQFDCNELVPNNPNINSDLLINALTAFCENENEFDFTLSSGERFIVGIVRNWRNRIPLSIQKRIKKFKNSSK